MLRLRFRNVRVTRVTKCVILAGKSRVNMENQRSKMTLIFQKEKACKARRINI